MNWSLSEYTAHLNAEEIFNKMCGRNALVVALVGNSCRIERNGMVERIPLERIGSDVSCKESNVSRKESNVDGSRRDVNGTDNATSVVHHSIFQRWTLARKRFSQEYQAVRKLDFTPANLLEKLDSDKGDESEIGEDDMIRLLE